MTLMSGRYIRVALETEIFEKSTAFLVLASVSRDYLSLVCTLTQFLIIPLKFILCPHSNIANDGLIAAKQA